MFPKLLWKAGRGGGGCVGGGAAPDDDARHVCTVFYLGTGNDLRAISWLLQADGGKRNRLPPTSHLPPHPPRGFLYYNATKLQCVRSKGFLKALVWSSLEAGGRTGWHFQSPSGPGVLRGFPKSFPGTREARQAYQCRYPWSHKGLLASVPISFDLSGPFELSF